MLNKAVFIDDIENIVHDEILTMLNENNIEFGVISNDVKLNSELGVTSLDLARLVSVLDDRLGVDPFIELISITSVRTIGDLVDAYQRAIANSVAA
jgi:acyl carrier protein